MQNITKKPASEGKRSYSSIARNIAIAVAALAFSYSQIAPHLADKEEPSKASDLAPVAVTTVDRSSVEASPTPSAAPSGEVKFGSDDNALAFRNFMKERAADVNKAGHVMYRQVDNSAISQDDLNRTQVPVPESPLQMAPVASQTASTPQGASHSSEEATTTGAPHLTTHPAPFIDRQALQSIQEHRAAVAQSGKQAVVKIGMYVDGMPMPESVKREQIRSTLSTIPDEWTVTYKAPNEKLRIYAFTDPTCPYCKKLHSALPQLMEAGISVHYLLYPRDMAAAQPGQLSVVAQNLKNVWCSVDQVAAMNDAFAGYKVAQADCAALPKSLNRLPAPVPDHYNLGEIFNVTGTPTLMASNGKSQAGFGTAQQIIQDFLD